MVTSDIVQEKDKVVNPLLSILDKDETLMYTAVTSKGNKRYKTRGK